MEGPSLAILKEELQVFLGKKVLEVSGNTKQPTETLARSRLANIDTWGKNLFLTFQPRSRAAPPIVTRTHFLMFGSYRIDDPRTDRFPRLELKFEKGILDFYSCSIRFGAAEDQASRDRGVDLMAESWNRAHVVALMERYEDALLCDLFLDQDVFAGSGNIVKNEVLFNIRRHPLTRLRQIPRTDWAKVASAVRSYCWNFFEWKKRFELRKHWQVYQQGVCPLCGAKLRRENLGKFNRRTFYCPRDQVLPARRSRVTVHAVLPMKTAGPPEKRLDH